MVGKDIGPDAIIVFADNVGTVPFAAPKSEAVLGSGIEPEPRMTVFDDEDGTELVAPLDPGVVLGAFTEPEPDAAAGVIGVPPLGEDARGDTPISVRADEPAGGRSGDGDAPLSGSDPSPSREFLPLVAILDSLSNLAGYSQNRTGACSRLSRNRYSGEY